MPTIKTVAQALAATALILPLTACATGADKTGPSTQSSSSGELSEVMSQNSLDTMGATEMIDHLDRLGGDKRPTDLMASVRPSEVVLSAGGEEKTLELPDDKFYLSFAPYVDQTHECFNHSLTTCQGELISETVQVEITDTTNDTVLLDDAVATFENGFIGIWLPRDIEGTIQVTYDGKTGEVDFATTEEAPTCLTTLQMV